MNTAASQGSSPNLPEIATPARILRAAAHYLAVHGWTQGDHYFHTTDADPSTWPEADVLGAIGVAVYARVYPNPDNPHLANWPVFSAACDVLYDYLDVADDYLHDRPDAGIGDWNDQPAMTAQQVIDTLTNAATRWETLAETHTSGGAA